MIESQALSELRLLQFQKFSMSLHLYILTFDYKKYNEFDYNLTQIQHNINKIEMFGGQPWRKGPTDHKVCSPAHDRPIFCLATSNNNFVTGSADHGLRQYSMQNGKHIRQLFSKKYGHKEWVSTCSYTPSGNIISGAMDSMVCYWDSRAVKCDTFLGHQGSISHVAANQKIGISASYDATIILWDLSRKDATKKLIGPHKEAVMTFDWHQSLLVSGDKSGVVGIWDLNKGELVRALKTHKGAVSKIKLDEKQQTFITGGINDGTVSAFDMRTNAGIYRQMQHKGALTDIKIADNLIFTASADHTLKIINSADFQTLKTVDIKDMAFALQYAHGVVIAATSGGGIVAVDAKNGDILFGYGVMKKGECRLLGLSKDKNKLVCAGEDQAPSLLFF